MNPGGPGMGGGFLGGPGAGGPPSGMPFSGFGEPRKPVVNGKEIDSRVPKDGIEITWKNNKRLSGKLTILIVDRGYVSNCSSCVSDKVGRG